MNALDIRDKLMEWTVAHSGLENRAYLGMSRIGECPLRLYREMLNGRTDFNAKHHLYCYAGYLWERDVKARLEAVGLYAPGSEQELVAAWDERFRGHTDGKLRDGRLLEIKSTHAEKLGLIRVERRLPSMHFQQVQCYLHCSGLLDAVVVYVARDTGQVFVWEAAYSPTVGARLEKKAEMILTALDARTAPGCECGKCEVGSD